MGCSPNRTLVRLRNNSKKNAELESVSLSGPVQGLAIEDLPKLPHRLKPGSLTNFFVRFDPSTPGAQRALLAVTLSINGQRHRLDRTILTRVVEPGPQTDTFTQGSYQKSDILFVVDNSCSMSEEQGSLARNFHEFLGQANEGLNDYRIAVTTTDLSDSNKAARGRIVPLDAPLAERVVTRAAQPSPLERFRENALVGIDGDGFEQGLEAAFLALSPARLKEENAGFLREDALLAVVYVSDEDDASPRNTFAYVEQLLALKNYERSLVSASAIVGPSPDGCKRGDERANAGKRYAEVAENLGGVVASICTEDWATALSEISAVAFGLKGRFILSGKPAGELKVFVNGRPRSEKNSAGQTNWAYDPRYRALHFSQHSTPPAGATITVQYTNGC